MQLSKLREKLEAIAREVEASTKESYMSSLAQQRDADQAAAPMKKAASAAAQPAPATEQHKPESHAQIRAKDTRPQKPIKPKVNELEEAEKRPKLFEPAAGPPPKVGEEELAAEGSGHEVLLQVI